MCPFLLVTLTLIVTLTLVKGQGDFQQLTFSVTEGEPSGTFVGNVGVQVGVFNSGSGSDALVKFELFDAGTDNVKLFTLDEQTGVVSDFTII